MVYIIQREHTIRFIRGKSISNDKTSCAQKGKTYALFYCFSLFTYYASSTNVKLGNIYGMSSNLSVKYY
jgi:hypothetical protein